MSRCRLSLQRFMRPSIVWAMSLSAICLSGAGTGSIRKLTIDEKAPVVELFEGIQQGQIDARLTAMNPYDGKVFVTNRTDKPLTVAVPKAVVGVHVLPQFGLNGGNNGFGNANGQANNNGANGQAQGVGGTLGAAGNGNGFPNAPGGLQNNLPGNNFFSIPPEKTVQLSLRSVCLNHGRPNPTAAMKYQLTKVESFTSDPVLQQLLEDYSPRTNQAIQQAAAWHLANGLSWKQLASLTDQHIPGVMTPIFSKSQLDSARELVEQTKKKAAERPATQDAAASAVTARRE